MIDWVSDIGIIQEVSLNKSSAPLCLCFYEDRWILDFDTLTLSAMKALPPAQGATGRFLAFFSVLVYAAFTFGGIEMIAASAGEAENPRKNIPKAIRRVFWRITLFYVLGTLALGMITSSDDNRLLNAQTTGAPGVAQSPWVIGITNAGITVLPSIINVVVLTSATSSANAFLYTGSRALLALAQNGQAPRIFLRCTKR
jgi:amino acid transporter